MNNISFKDVLIGEEFVFGTRTFKKIDEFAGETKEGVKIFNLQEIVSKELGG